MHAFFTLRGAEGRDLSIKRCSSVERKKKGGHDGERFSLWMLYKGKGAHRSSWVHWRKWHFSSFLSPSDMGSLNRDNTELAESMLFMIAFLGLLGTLNILELYVHSALRVVFFLEANTSWYQCNALVSFSEGLGLKLCTKVVYVLLEYRICSSATKSNVFL